MKYKMYLFMVCVIWSDMVSAGAQVHSPVAEPIDVGKPYNNNFLGACSVKTKASLMESSSALVSKKNLKNASVKN